MKTYTPPEQRETAVGVHALKGKGGEEVNYRRFIDLTWKERIARYSQLLFIGLFLIGTLFLCSSCVSTKGTKASAAHGARKSSPEELSLVTTTENEPEKTAARKPQEIGLPEYKPEKAPKELPTKEPIDPKKLVHFDTPVLINVDSMPLSSFIVYAVGDTLKVTYVLDEAVMNMKNPVTLKMGAALSPAQVMEIVLGFLEKYDLDLEEKAGALYISKTRVSTRKPVDVRVGRSARESGAEILQIVPLNYLRANETDGLIRDLYKTGVTVRLYQKENALLLSGPASSIREIIDFISVFDVPYMQNKKPYLVKLTYWQPEDFIKQLSLILEGLGFSIAKSSKDPGIFIIPVKVLNSILIAAPDTKSIKYVFDWVERLDNADSAGTEEKSFIYTPKYSKASDLVDSLDKLYGVTERSSGQQATQGQQAASGGTTTRPQTGAQPGGSSSGQSRGLQDTQKSRVLISPGLRIAADDKRNVVLINALPSKYKNILNYLGNLDVPPKQVLIEATIAELTLKDDLQYGLEWYVKNKMKMPGTKSVSSSDTTSSSRGTYTLGTLGNLAVDTTQGLYYTFVSDNQNFQVALNVFAQDNKLNVLSSPRIMVIDNQEAHIQIGTDVPIITGETKSTSETTQNVVTTQSVQYRSTGLMVTVKPNINTEGMLTMEITLESSEAQQNTLSDVNSPLILTRRLETNIVAASEETIVIGGLMSENLSNTLTKVPLLGDIPIIGNAFKNTSKSKTKTELIITIRPIIITNTEDAVAVSNDIRESLKWFK